LIPHLINDPSRQLTAGSVWLCTGWFSFAAFSDNDLDRSPLIHCAGYSVETKPPGTQWFDAGCANRYTNAFMSCRVDTEAGQSGAPIFFLNSQDQRWVVATQGYGLNNANLDRRIDDEIFNVLSDCIS